MKVLRGIFLVIALCIVRQHQNIALHGGIAQLYSWPGESLIKAVHSTIAPSVSAPSLTPARRPVKLAVVAIARRARSSSASTADCQAERMGIDRASLGQQESNEAYRHEKETSSSWRAAALICVNK